MRKLKNLNVTSEKRTGVKIKEIKYFAPDLKIDWLHVINDHFLQSEYLTEEDEINIESPGKLKLMLKTLASLDKQFVPLKKLIISLLTNLLFRILADAFALKFMYAHRPLFILYAHDKLDEGVFLTIKAIQRWEQCVAVIDHNMDTATEFLLSIFFPRDFEKIQKFADGVVQDFIKKVETMEECVLSSEVKKNVVEKLNNSVVFRADSLDLEDFYGDLNLNGTENLVRSLLETRKFRRRIDLTQSEPSKYIFKYSIFYLLEGTKMLCKGISR